MMTNNRHHPIALSTIGFALMLALAPACENGEEEEDDEVGETETTDDTTESTTDTDTTDTTTETETDTETETTETETETDTETDTLDTETDETDTTDTGMELSFEVDVYPILQDACSCHVGGSPAGLALPDATASYDNLVNVASTQEPTLDRVTPGDPDNSYLYQKIAGTGGGAQMPLNMPPLSDADMMTVYDWIAEGALP